MKIRPCYGASDHSRAFARSWQVRLRVACNVKRRPNFRIPQWGARHPHLIIVVDGAHQLFETLDWLRFDVAHYRCISKNEPLFGLIRESHQNQTTCAQPFEIVTRSPENIAVVYPWYD